MTAFANIARFGQPGPQGRVFNFPNGQHPSVIADPHVPFRFELYAADIHDDATANRLRFNIDRLRVALTTEQVEALLVEIAALPAEEN